MAIKAINPVNGKIFATYDEMTPSVVSGIISDVNEAFLKWRHTSFEERAAMMREAARMRTTSAVPLYRGNPYDTTPAPAPPPPAAGAAAELARRDGWEGWHRHRDRRRDGCGQGNEARMTDADPRQPNQVIIQIKSSKGISRCNVNFSKPHSFYYSMSSMTVVTRPA
jgi:Aldehyde dehydrogenase family